MQIEDIMTMIVPIVDALYMLDSYKLFLGDVYEVLV